MLQWTLLAVLLSAEPARPFTSPRPSPPEYGHGLSADDTRAGWISLYDGRTPYGWANGEVEDLQLRKGVTTTPLADAELRLDVAAPGKLHVGKRAIDLPIGRRQATISGWGRHPWRLGEGLALRSIAIRSPGLKSVFNSNDLDGWRAIERAQIPPEKRPKWTVEAGALRGRGGPGSVELQQQYADLMLQLEIRTRAPLANAGVFFRAQPGLSMMGYEAQVFNACYDHDPAQPVSYSTGGIDDRQLARRLVSRDLESCVMTVIAVGPHVSTWVNGIQLTDWTDTRPEHENPRLGLRLAAGTIQLQAHDPATDVEFKNIRVCELK